MATSDSPKSIAATGTLQVAVKAGAAPQVLQYIFSDDFSSGDLSKTENGFTWTGGFRLSPSTENPRSGTHSLKARYQSIDDPANGNTPSSWLERSFDLGAFYTSLVIEFDLYIPDGNEPWGGPRYVHRDSELSDNNKLFRLWSNDSDGNGYVDSQSKLGASTNLGAISGDSQVYLEGKPNSTDGTIREGFTQKSGAFNAFITDADRGQWMSLKFDMKMPTQFFTDKTQSDGHYKMTKNGSTILEIQLNNFRTDTVSNSNAWKVGYLLGWANSGFVTETLLFVDNVKFSGVLK